MTCGGGVGGRISTKKQFCIASLQKKYITKNILDGRF
jgi:hypothetical protein